MTKRIILTLLIYALFGAIFNFTHGQNSSSIIFIENKGQWPSEVRFSADIPGGMMFIEENSLTYSFEDPDDNHSSTHLFVDDKEDRTSNHYALKVKFLDATSGLVPKGVNQTKTNYNYFLGTDRSKWVSGAKGYTQVIIENLYPGVNLEISSGTNNIKYDLKLKPGANPNCIQMLYAGATSLGLADENLIIGTPYLELREKIPASYAFCDDRTREINSSYRIEGEVVSFEISEVDPEEAVTIDPLLVFSTYSGSIADNWGNTATFDDQGNGYSGGMTNSTRGGEYLGEFPATEGAYQTISGGGWDVAILKYDSAGHNLLYATQLGGSGTEVPQSLIVNEQGELLILGITGSSDFPITSSAFDNTYNGGTSYELIGGVDFVSGSDLFVAKLSSDGSQLLASTYIGGTLNDGAIDGTSQLARNYGDESRGDINFDSNGDVIVSSRTKSANFPTLNSFDSTFLGVMDGVLLKMSPNLDVLKWSTFLGGSGSDVALSVKIDRADNIFVAGGTTSTNFPVTDSAFVVNAIGDVDGWVAHITASGDSIISSTYIGTSAYDQVFFLDLDADENVYLAGQTLGSYPISTGLYSSGTSGQFIHKLSNNLATSLFSTTINVPGATQPAISLTAFLVNECDNIYLAGWGSTNNAFTSGNNFNLNTHGLPITSDAFQANSDGSSFYLMVLSGDASELLYATHLGDANSLVHVDGGTSRFDKHGIVYHSVCASCFGDSSFPTTEGAWSTQNGSTGCNNALFKFDLASLRARIRTNNLKLDNPGLTGGCLPLDVVFENFSTGGEFYEWDFGDGSNRITQTLDTVVHQYKLAGTYNVELRAYDPNTCISEDFAYVSFTVTAPDFRISEDVNICKGSSTQLFASGGLRYVWSPAVGLSDPLIANPIANPEDTTTYSVTILNIGACNLVDSLTVNVIPNIEVSVSLELSGLCNGSREVTLFNESQFAESATWDMGDGTLLEGWQPSYTYASDGQYTVTGTLVNGECLANVTLNLNLRKLHIPNVLTRNNDGKNDALIITAGEPVDLVIYTRWGTKIFSERNYQNEWKGEGLSNGIYFYEVILTNNEVCNGWIQLLD